MSQLPVLWPHEIEIRNPDIADNQTSDLNLSIVLNIPIYLIGNTHYDALSGEALPTISRQEALSIVRERVNVAITDAELVEQVAIDSGYRSGELPAWQVTLREENAAIYVGLRTR